VAITKEVKVGLLAIIAGTVLYLGFNFLKGIDFLSPTSTYWVVYEDVGGLTVSNPVLLNGLQVGRVHTTKLRNSDHKILVQLEIDNDVPIGDSSVALLANNGILGGKAIVLVTNVVNKNLEDGDTLIAAKERGVQDIIYDKAGPVINDLDTMIVGLNGVLTQIRAEERLAKILANFQKISQQLDLLLYDNSKNLNGITTNFNKLSASLVETEKSLKPLLDKMNTLADSLNQMPLAQTVENANNSMKNLNGILTEINEGQGSIGKLVKTEELHSNLNQTVQDLDKLFLDIQARPKRYVHFSVFGGNKKEKKEAKKAEKQKK
jgi:phospholipid/cholesterol/gamma-HCH transport system substrate-binding protein